MAFPLWVVWGKCRSGASHRARARQPAAFKAPKALRVAGVWPDTSACAANLEVAPLRALPSLSLAAAQRACQLLGLSVEAGDLPGSVGWWVKTTRCQLPFSRVTVKVSRKG